MPIQIRVLTWNIAEGIGDDKRQPPNISIPGLAERLQEFCPDILLLNEVINYPLDGMKQAQEIGRRLFMPFTANSDHTPLGFARKSVSIVSRYPLSNIMVHPVMLNGVATSYCILEARTTIQGRRHQLFSLRFDGWHEAEKFAGIAQMAMLAATVRSTDAVILGGDFNHRSDAREMQDFASNALTKTARIDPVDSEWVSVDGEAMIDHIYYRGPYRNQWFRAAQDWAGNPNLSDHPYVIVDLVNEGEALQPTFGARVKLKHWATGSALHSHPLNYTHPDGSTEQQVTGYAPRDDNDFWILRNAADVAAAGALVANGADIALCHEATGKWLCCDDRFSAPTGSKLEASAVAAFTANCVWVLDIERGTSPLALGDVVRLRHKATGQYLYAVPGSNGGAYTANQQEVCVVGSRDSQSRWSLFEHYNPEGALVIPAPKGWLAEIAGLFGTFIRGGGT